MKTTVVVHNNNPLERGSIIQKGKPTYDFLRGLNRRASYVVRVLSHPKIFPYWGYCILHEQVYRGKIIQDSLQY